MMAGREAVSPHSVHAVLIHTGALDCYRACLAHVIHRTTSFSSRCLLDIFARCSVAATGGFGPLGAAAADSRSHLGQAEQEFNSFLILYFHAVWAAHCR